MAERKGLTLFLLLGLLFISASRVCSEEDVEDQTKEDVPESIDLLSEEEEDDFDELEESEKAAEEAGGDSPGQDGDVLILTTKNFDEVINSRDTVLVEFYAPWCGHCKSLAPEYKRAAATLKDNDPPVTLAMVDATQENDLAQRFSVSGYPTLTLFKKGVDSEYTGPRNEAGIVAYMKDRADPNWAPPPPAVLTLTKDNFDDTINNADIILVEFFAPWCGHCKQLAPEYEKAAKQLKDGTPPIPLATVDATKEPEISQKYGVSGYPTMFIFRKGVKYEYKGERTQYGIVDYMQKQAGDASKEVTNLKDMKALLDQAVDRYVHVGFFESAEDALYKTFQDASNDLREDFILKHTFNKDVAKFYKASVPSVVAMMPSRFYTKYEQKQVAFTQTDANPTQCQQFIRDNSVPLVGQYDHTSKDKLYQSRRPLCLVFYTVDWSFDHRKATQMWRNKVADIATKQKDVTFAIADDDQMGQDFKDFGFDDSGEEINIGCFDKNNRKYPMEAMEEWDSDEIEEYLAKFSKGALKPHLKSQPIPKRSSGPVTVVVGKNFEDVVMDSKKDVLIEFYAPWCGHCKTLEPIYKKLAKKYKDDKNLVIAKIDATANESPSEFTTEGFPTIFFAPSSDKKNPIKHEGGRELKDLEEFMKKHATVSLGKSLKEEL